MKPLFSLSIFFIALFVVPSYAVAQSMEETIEWIKARGNIESSLDRFNGGNQIIAFNEKTNTLTITRHVIIPEKFPNVYENYYHVYEIPLSKLSPNDVKARCKEGDNPLQPCPILLKTFNNQKGIKGYDIKKKVKMNFVNHSELSLFSLPYDERNRMINALRHAIKLAGGKPEPF